VLCNSRGDVVDIYNQNGTPAVHYIYDSWGNTVSVLDNNGNEITAANHIGILNQIRYRGYYLDAETGYYYLMSRYYNPTVGRFLNADLYTTTGQTVLSTNMFAYCENNPIIYSDSDGYLADAAFADVPLMAYLAELLAAIAVAVTSINWMPILICILVFTAIAATAYLGYTLYQNSKVQAQTKADADAEILTKIKNRGNAHYWEANRHGDYVTIGAELSYAAALERISNGGDIFAASAMDAYFLTMAASGNLIPYGPEVNLGKNGVPGFYWHYHRHKNDHVHVFYL